MKIFIVIFATLISSTFAINFYCEFTNEIWTLLGEAMTCKATLTFLYSQNFTYDGNLSGDASEVQMIKISNKSLSYIPKDMRTVFSNISAIHLGSCGINYLNNNDLENYKIIQWLSLSQNQIEYVPENFFKPTPDIKAVYFYGNRIKSVGFNSLQPLKYLKLANFRDNICISQFASTSEQIEKLMYDLNENCINSTIIPPNDLQCGEGSISDRICNLESKNEILVQQNDDLKSELSEVHRKLDEIREGLFGFSKIHQAILGRLSLHEKEEKNYPENEN